MKILFLIFSCMFFNLYATQCSSSISFDDMDWDSSLGYVEEIIKFEKIAKSNILFLRNDTNDGKFITSLIKEQLGENNFFSFIFTNNILDDKKFGKYFITFNVSGLTQDSKYWDRNVLLETLLEDDFSDEYKNKSDELPSESDLASIFGKESFTNLKVIDIKGNELVGEFDFDLFTVKIITGKCIFSAIKNKKGKWEVQELRIKKRGSDKLEDGLLVYDIKKIKRQTTRKIKSEIGWA